MDLRKVRVYVISPGEGKYETRLMNTIQRLQSIGFADIEHVQSVPDSNPTDSLTQTNLVIWEKEKERADPFIIVEDDIQIGSIADLVISVPPNTAAIYLGVSIWAYPYEYHTLSCGKDIRIITENDTHSYNNQLAKIQGMTSAHAILYLDRDFTKTLSLCVRSHLELHTAHDLILAALQRHFQVYAMKLPIFYQDITEGGQQLVTKLMWRGDRFLPY